MFGFPCSLRKYIFIFHFNDNVIELYTNVLCFTKIKIIFSWLVILMIDHVQSCLMFYITKQLR